MTDKDNLNESLPSVGKQALAVQWEEKTMSTPRAIIIRYDGCYNKGIDVGPQQHKTGS